MKSRTLALALTLALAPISAAQAGHHHHHHRGYAHRIAEPEASAVVGSRPAASVVPAVVLGFAYGDAAGYRAGECHAEERAESNRKSANEMMCHAGICSWARIMAAKIECQHEFQPGDP